MKTAAALALAAVLLGTLTLTACETSQPGVKNKLIHVSATVDGNPDKVTAAAKETLEDMRLVDISAQSTRIDGYVTARTAQDRPVTINVTQAGENVSNVTVRVGHFGDEALSLRILDGIRENLE